MPFDPRPAREWPIPPMDHGSGNKASAFTWEMGHLILQRIADGETVKAITADPRMPAYCTVFRWMKVVPAFGEAVARLRTVMAQAKLAERDARRALRGPRRWPGGRRSEWTPEIGAAICRAIEDGASVTEMAARPGAPAAATVYRWLARHPEFRAAFVEACAVRVGWYLFQAEFLVPDEVCAIGIPAANRAIRALEGCAGRRAPRVYREGV